MQIERQGRAETHISSAHLYAPLSHQTSLPKRKFKDNITKNFKMGTVLKKQETRCRALLSTGPYVTAQVSCPWSQPWQGGSWKRAFIAHLKSCFFWWTSLRLHLEQMAAIFQAGVELTWGKADTSEEERLKGGLWRSYWASELTICCSHFESFSLICSWKHPNLLCFQVLSVKTLLLSNDGGVILTTSGLLLSDSNQCLLK